ncbi:uncharacterized protein BYT42DRAFT_571205 [Radiomyces spectabilis]|uniref:uncharacterized protein n=1 Tax=Radiomyces spectabilis TaxID=64574 RepID=UPI0022206994|nr:uncharacterized protein BYT42DRAFT_571205 [Radiomyces spectabilis]KAI8377680.1 hypothetical protein BYT42DRAFT_571205 [Radiomyces spectabilis]
MAQALYRPLVVGSAQQTARYEATNIATAYLNAIRNQFGNRLRMAVNSLLNVKQRKRELTQQLQELDTTPAVGQATSRYIGNSVYWPTSNATKQMRILLRRLRKEFAQTPIW